MIIGSERQTHRECFSVFIEANHGDIAFGLVTSVDGEIEFYERPSQPCYGELRKYNKTHGDEATKGESRPSDLEHPFPDGRPEALCVPFTQKLPQEILNFVFSTSMSPWKNGLPKNQDDIEVLKNGVILWDLKLDSTVLVNLLNCLKIVEKKIYALARKKGDEFFSLFFSMEFNRWGSSEDRLLHVEYTGYYTPVLWDIARFCRGEAFDLTGGTLEERFDYERKQLHTIFASKDGLDVREFSKPFSIFTEGRWGKEFSGFKIELLDEIFKEFEKRRTLDLGEYPLPVIPGPLKEGDPVEVHHDEDEYDDDYDYEE